MAIKFPDRTVVKNRVEIALQTLLCNDRELLLMDVNERTITHKLAEYLQTLFKGWHVDCEYNRMYNEGIIIQKRLLLSTHDSSKLKERNVYPDIIVHRRNSNNNLLVVEVKKSSTVTAESRNFDLEKLQSYISDLHYSYGLFLVFKADNTLESSYEPEWYPKQ